MTSWSATTRTRIPPTWSCHPAPSKSKVGAAAGRHAIGEAELVGIYGRGSVSV